MVKPRPRILFLVPEDMRALQSKGIMHMIHERDENGFFEKVITVHPLAYETQYIELDSTHSLYEFNLRKLFYPRAFGLLMFLLPIKFIVVIIKLLKLMRKEKIDIIRATDPYLMGCIAWILSRLSGKNYCISVHSDYPLVFKLNPQTGFKRILRIITRWMPAFVCPRANMLMPISQYLKHTLPKRVMDKNIKVIYHGIDFDFTPLPDMRVRFNLPSDKKIISYVARLSKDNYIDDILCVVERLTAIRNDFLLVMVGDGELMPYITAWLNEHPKAATCIKLVGFQPNEIGRSIRYLSHISLCLMSGFSLIEAAAAATPLISYDIEWHGELVQNYQTGFLVKEHDLEGLQSAVCYLLDNPNHATRMGKKARDLAYARHNLSTTTKIKQECYLALINHV